MDPIIAASLIGAGGNLIGGAVANAGLKGNESRFMVRYNHEQNWKAQKNMFRKGPWEERKGLERAGINPLFGWGQGTPAASVTGQPGENGGAIMGAAISSAASNLADGISDRHLLEVERSAVEAANAKLAQDRQDVDRARANLQLAARPVPSITYRPDAGALPVVPGMAPAAHPDGVPVAQDGSVGDGGYGVTKVLGDPDPVVPVQTNYDGTVIFTQDPFAEVGPDGLLAANRLNPAEAEADLWANFRAGDIARYGGALLTKNVANYRKQMEGGLLGWPGQLVMQPGKYPRKVLNWAATTKAPEWTVKDGLKKLAADRQRFINR